MARKDVDLVIRAKDEAAKVVDAITDALNEFISAQSDLNKSAGKTSSTLGALGAAFGALDKELRGMSVGDKLTKELDAATAAASRLEAEFEETVAASLELALSLEKAEAATERLKNKTEGALAAQTKAAGVLEKQKAAQAELTAALAEATKERDRLVRQEASLAAKTEKQSARVAETTERYNRLAAELAAATGPTKTLQSRLESVGTSLGKQTTKLDELRAKHEATQAAIGQTGARMSDIAAKLGQANDAVTRQQTIVGKIGANYKELSVAAKAAAKNQAGIADAVDKTSDVLDRQVARIARAESELAQLSVAAGRADAAFDELANRSGQAFNKALAQQRREMLEAKREWVASTQQIKLLSQEIGRVGVPTRQMAEAFGKARIEAAANKQEYVAQRNGLHALSGVMRQAGTDVEGLRTKQAQFIQVQNQTGQAILGIRQRAQQLLGSYNLLGGSATRASAATRQVADGVRSTASATQQAARSTNALADAYRRLYGESRQALSLTQRLRGEVLSLVSAYGGIFGVISLLQQTVGAYQTLEAAQSRLNVAFEGNKSQVGKELDFIRRNADRLGIEFGTLASEYSKFAVATQGTNLEGEKTRKIFISVAEAARVSKISNEQLQGVFTALSQIVSKGAVQMEELRQQLGDRLPGAIQIMADGLGVGTDELIKMMEQGQITADALVPFAEELDRRFGPGLAEALAGTTTAMGQFRNAAFQALLAFGNAGFIEKFTNLLRDLTEVLQSADFQAFAARVSQAFGVLMDAIGLAARNFDLLVIAAAAFAGVKLTPLVLALGNSFVDMAGKIRRVGTIMNATKNVMVTTAATTSGLAAVTGVASTALRGLALAIRAVLSATGVGFVVTAITTGIALWATRADEATEALNRHRKIVDAVRNEYDKAGKSVENWGKEIKSVTALQAVDNLKQVEAAARTAREGLKGLSSGTGVAILTGEARKQAEALRDLTNAYRETGGDVDAFKAKVQAIADAALDDRIKEYALNILNAADELKTFEQDVQDARDILLLKTGTTEEAAAAMKRLSGSTGDAGDAAKTATGSTDQYREALEKINDILPEINKGLDDLKTKAQIDEAFQSAARAAQTMGELQGAIDAANAAYGRMNQNIADSNFGNFTDGAEASAAVLRRFEGFRSQPYFDTNAFRVGFGSDTITLSDGTIQRVTQGMRISVADANRDLIRRIGEFQQGIRESIGGDRFAGMTPQQQAALTSIAYNYGSLPERIIEAVRSGTDQEIAAAIRALGGDNGGINRNRRNVEAALFTSTAGVEPLAQEQQREAERAEQERQRQREHTQETIADQQAEIANQQLINAGKEREAAIEKAIAEARKADPNITAEEIAQIREQTGALFDLKKVRELDKSQQQEAEAMMQRVNALLQQRTVLEQQLKLAQQSGDSTKVQEAQTAIANVNTQLDEAIAKAREMWNSIGGAAADTALIKLDTAAAKASNLAAKAQQNYIDWSRVGQLFASGLTNAFDNFAKAVAEGEDVGEAARRAFLQFASDFLRQIAQMIIQQAILNAMRSFGFPGVGGVGVGVAHTGGVVGGSRVGSGNSTRRVDPGIFLNARRFHTGGVPGLRPGEVPAIVEQNEEILTRDDPRHILNGGGAAAAATGQQSNVQVRNVNVFNAEDMLERALRSRVGEKVILNFIRDNPNAVQAALEGKG